MTETIVVKAGGEIVEDDEYLRYLVEDIEFLHERGNKITLVYGGKNRITEELSLRYREDPKFTNGLRNTDERSIEAVQYALDRLGADIADFFEGHGFRDYELFLEGIYAEWQETGSRVGNPIGIKPEIKKSLEHGKIAVVSPLGISEDRTTYYNVNADGAAYVVAVGVGADKLIYLTSVDGIIYQGGVVPIATEDDIRQMTGRVIFGGMQQKAFYSLKARREGVDAVYIANGQRENPLVSALSPEGVRTQVI